MPRKSSNALKVKNMFVEAHNEYLFWSGQLKTHEWNADTALVAAQYYGQMCALARVNSEMFDSDALKGYLNDLNDRGGVKLYKYEYEKS